MALQLLFTYTLIYFLMPKYLIKEKYWAFAAGVILLTAVAVLTNYYINYHTQALIYQFFAVKPPGLSANASFFRSLDSVLFNLPTIGSIALGIKLMKHWWLKQEEVQQLTVSKANAELQLLKAQVHPHFLFNTLNNIYSFILTSSSRAPGMVKKLSGLLRYIIHECNQTQVALAKELQMIQDYISLETIRYGDQFDITIDIKGDYNNKKIAPLLLLPFVENSFKHGASKTLSRPWVSLNIIIENSTMYFMLNNSRPQEYTNLNHNGGIGLSNVQKRLQLLYPARHELKVTSEQERFTVLLEIVLQPVNEKQAFKKLKKERRYYEMA
jgi:sensor histidine kinase YesM